MMRILAVLLTFFASLSAAHAMEAPETQYDLFAAQADVTPGQSVPLALEFRPKRGWHLYWENPGDTGLAPQAYWDLPQGGEVAPLKFPTPESFTFAGFVNYGYTMPFTLLTDMKVPSDAPAGPLKVAADIEWLACDDEVCVPEAGRVEIALNVVSSAAPAASADPYFATVGEAIPMETDWAGQYQIDDGALTLQVPLSISREDVQSVELFPITQAVIVYEAEQNVAWSDDGTLQVQVDAQSETVPGDALNAVLKITPKGDGPVRGYAISAVAGDLTPIGDGGVEAPGVVAALGVTASLPTAIAFALIGGLLLNLMPCVFPVLSLKAFSLASSGPDAATAKRDGWLYTAGILVSFGLLAGTLLALRAAGAQLGWGFQLQSPVVIAGLALLMFLIALNLFGVFEFGGRLANTGQGLLAGRSKGTQSFLTGVLATVVATPCTAPFMATALSFAITQPAPAAIFVFLCLGFGLALPFLLIAYSPALRERLPRPGAWMETFKQFLGFPMLATMLWLLWVLYGQGGQEALFLTLGIALLIGFALWAWGQGSGASKRVFAFASIGAVMIGALGFWQIDYSQQLAQAVPAKLAQQSYSDAKLAQLVAEKTPVFVYFTADWCITCKANERLALKTEAVSNGFKAAGVEVLVGDWTRRDSAIAKTLAKFGRAGVPLYLYYPPDGSGQPTELPQILRPSTVLEAIGAPT